MSTWSISHWARSLQHGDVVVALLRVDEQKLESRHVWQRCVAGARRLVSARRGAVALELAFVSVPFLVFVLGVMEVSYDLFVQSALDNAVATASRAVQVGSAIGTAGQTEGQFLAQAICPNLSKLLSCNLLTVAVAPIPATFNYYTAPAISFASASAGHICTGQAGEAMQMAAWYAAPSFVGLLIPGFTSQYNGRYVHFSYSSTGFVNEYFSGPGELSSGGTACS